MLTGARSGVLKWLIRGPFFWMKSESFPKFNLSSQEKRLIAGYQWPGNIRELKNVMERSALLSEGNKLELDLPLNTADSLRDPFGDKPTLNEIQRRYIGYVLDYTKGKISGHGGACQILKIKRISLYSKMKILGFNRDKA